MSHPATISAPSSSIPRRHDLDALRAIAMLLGIALHVMISFIPGIAGGWAVQDSQTSAGFGIAMAAIHGFRMPLFFLISGFFTMMMLRKRGLWPLLKQRFVRIFLPFLLGMFTVIPAVWAVSIYVSFQTPSTAPASAAAAEVADTALAEDESLASDLSTSETSGWLAAANGDVDALQTWIDGGGNVSHREEDGATALHGAFLFGRADTAAALMAAGADPDFPNLRGETPKDMLKVSWGITSYVAGLTKVIVIEDEVFAGRGEIADTLQLSDANQIAAKETGLQKLKFALLYLPITGHLWFLWFLCWLVAGFAFVVSVVKGLRIPRPPRWMSASVCRYAWLIPLTMLAQSFMSGDGLGFGPDTSIGILPMPAVLAYYAIFFGFGAIYFDATAMDSSSKLSPWRSWLALAVALLVLFPLGLAVRGQAGNVGQCASLFLQASYAWLMTFGAMGAFSQLLSRESKWMRYLSDSSYWLYLVHIPLVIYGQYWIRDYAISPYLKFPLLCVVVSAVLLLSYQIFVRYTPIGTLLNGKRNRTKGTAVAIDATNLEQRTLATEVGAG